MRSPATYYAAGVPARAGKGLPSPRPRGDVRVARVQPGPRARAPGCSVAVRLTAVGWRRRGARPRYLCQCSAVVGDAGGYPCVQRRSAPAARRFYRRAGSARWPGSPPVASAHFGGGPSSDFLVNGGNRRRARQKRRRCRQRYSAPIPPGVKGPHIITIDSIRRCHRSQMDTLPLPRPRSGSLL